MSNQQQIQQPFQIAHHLTPSPQNLQPIPSQGKLSLSLFPESMLTIAQEHVKMHGLSSIPGLIDENEQMICSILLKHDPNIPEQPKLTGEMKQELTSFIRSSLSEAPADEILEA